MNYFTIIFLLCCAAVANGTKKTSSSGTSSHNGTEGSSSHSQTPGIASRSATEGASSHFADGGTLSRFSSKGSFKKFRTQVDCFFQGRNHVKFYLYNHQNASNPRKLRYNSIINSDWVDIEWPTVLCIHGWRGRHRLAELMKKAYLEESEEHVNLIEVDWLRGAYSPLYFPCARRVPNVGETVAHFIGLNQKKFNMNRFTIVGHSLGAHAAGFAGKSLQSHYKFKPRLIIGLDPAGPLFQGNILKLQPEDADTVLVIHTSQRFGHLEPLGTIDVYINGGKIQPGCSDAQSHGFAKLIYKELVNGKEPFVGRRYSSFADVRNDIVPQTEEIHLFRIEPYPPPGTLLYLSTMEQPNLTAEVKEYIDSKLHNDVGVRCTIM